MSSRGAEVPGLQTTRRVRGSGWCRARRRTPARSGSAPSGQRVWPQPTEGRRVPRAGTDQPLRAYSSISASRRRLVNDGKRNRLKAEMPVKRLLCSAMLASLCLAQPPTFTSAAVLPVGGDRPVALSPGLLMSIYGEHLGPSLWLRRPRRPGTPRNSEPSAPLSGIRRDPDLPERALRHAGSPGWSAGRAAIRTGAPDQLQDPPGNGSRRNHRDPGRLPG